MDIKIIDGYPESGVRCSEITLQVRITYGQPFIAPGEWDHDWMLRQLVNDEPLERIGIEGYDVNCSSHIEWVELKPIKYKINAQEFETIPDQEYAYRDACQRAYRSPSQAGFWRYVLKHAHGVQQVT